MAKQRQTSKWNQDEEFKTTKNDLVKAVTKINWWEWIPIVGAYIYFARITFAKINYIKSIRKATTKYLKYYQHAFALVALPFVIWTIYLWAVQGWGFYYPQLGIIIAFTLQFVSPWSFKFWILKGLSTI